MCASSEHPPLDDIDRAILQLLQRDARNATAVDIAEEIGVSDATVRNRIGNLEQQGIIKGYVPTINYEKAGYQTQIRIRCSARIVEREQLAKEALQIGGVVGVGELMTGRENVEVTAVAARNEDVTRIAEALDELGFEVESEELIRQRYLQPFNHFGTEDGSGET